MIAWCEEVERVVKANNWRAAQVYTIVAAYLRGAAVEYYEEERTNINVWADGNAANNLKNLLIVQFALNNIKDIWYSNYLNC